MEYGLIREKLPHSFSKEIHARLADYQYDLIELTEEELPKFFEKKDFEFVTAINYTGLFLCAKYAAIIMQAQHEADTIIRFSDKKSG